MTKCNHEPSNVSIGTSITDLSELAKHCDLFKKGAKKMYDAQGERADMWLFELYHHLDDCAAAFRRKKIDQQ